MRSAADEPGPDEPASTPTSASRLREAIVLGSLALIGTAVLLWWIARPPSPVGPGSRGATATRPAHATAADLVGNDTCAECHPTIAVHHQRHGHARTLRRAADRGLAAQLDGRTVPDPERPGVSWSFVLEDGRFAVDRRTGGRVERLPIDFAFGSGYHATTFVSLLEDDPARLTAREHRLTAFADGTLRVTPGQQLPNPLPGTDALGRIHARDEAFRCFQCHVTVPSADDLGRLDVESMIPSITCERCHGPGRSHVDAARRGDDADSLALPFGPGRSTTEGQMRLCGTCHRHPSQLPVAALRPDNTELARFQPAALMQSPCYTRSNGALSCTTCHDPHRRPATRPESYTPTCLSCHSTAHPDQVPCPVSPSSDCTSCHMPTVDAGQGVFFADHWIRVRDNVARIPTAD